MRISTLNDGRLKRRSTSSQPSVFKRWFKRKGGGGGHASSGHSSSSSRGSSSGKGGSSSTAAKHGASTKFTSSRSSGSFSLSSSGLGKSTATAYSDGGGKPTTLGSGSAFSGRTAGGGARTNVYGSSRFGSGYPYGGDGIYVDLRPLPYYFYPVPPAHNYYGGDEYLNVSDAMRPGGALVEAIVQPEWNTSSVTYRIIGDNTSVTAVFDAIVANCSVANSSTSIAAFNPSPLTYPLPEQIIQYYRSSSLALSLDGYNNTAALASNMPTSNNSAPNNIPDTPLPSNLNMTFLACINQTTAASVPLVDVQSHKLSSGAIGGIIAGSIIGIFVLIFIYAWIATWSCWRRWNPKNWHLKEKLRAVKARRKVPEVNIVGTDDKEADRKEDKVGLLNSDAASIVSTAPPSYHEGEQGYLSSPITPTQGWDKALKPGATFDYHHVRTGSMSSAGSSPRSSFEVKLPEDKSDRSFTRSHLSPVMPTPDFPHSYDDPFSQHHF